MKGKLGFAVLLAGLFWLAPRLSHPAVDVGKLRPAELVLISMESSEFRIETEDGAKGQGKTLEEAAADLRAGAAGEVMLETTAYLLLSGDVREWEALAQLFPPDCRVCAVTGDVDLHQVLPWLKSHPPRESLRRMRMENGKMQELIRLEGSWRLVT